MSEARTWLEVQTELLTTMKVYLVEVFTAANAAPERVREAQVALNSFRMEG
jgi:hypothetical protein